MNETQKNVTLLFALVALVLLEGFAASRWQGSQTYGSPIQAFTAYNTTNATTTCSAVSAVLFASSTGRSFIYVANEGTGTISVCLGGTCGIGQGIQINASSSYTMNMTNPYWGPISCIMTAGNTTTIGTVSNQ